MPTHCIIIGDRPQEANFFISPKIVIIFPREKFDRKCFEKVNEDIIPRINIVEEFYIFKTFCGDVFTTAKPTVRETRGLSRRERERDERPAVYFVNSARGDVERDSVYNNN